MLALALSLALHLCIPTEDQQVERVHYATQTESVILRNWTPPDYQEYVSDNITSLDYEVDAATTPVSVHPARIGRVERTSIGSA